MAPGPVGGPVQTRRAIQNGRAAMTAVTERERAQSGGHGTSVASVRSGYLPVPLRCVPPQALRQLAVYIQSEPGAGSGSGDGTYTLYRSPTIPFTADDRERLLQSGRRFVFIAFADQMLYRQQTEQALNQTVRDPGLALSEKSQIVYDTSIEIVNELLADPTVALQVGRTEALSRSISTLVLSDISAFRQLFAVSHHDFYTASHMVNVATWLVPLADALGHRNPEELTEICEAGLLHDIGKVFVSEKILNQKERLTPEQWQVLQQHPVLGHNHLSQVARLSPLVLRVCREHHERLDGSGYPNRLRAADIHPISRMVAVVDAFDAMTSIRPYRAQSLTISDAILELQAGVPHRYDGGVVKAWVRLLDNVHDTNLRAPAAGSEPGSDAPANRRRNKRYRCDCPARVCPLSRAPAGGLREGASLPVRVHNISRFGLGLLSPKPVEVGTPLRAYIAGLRLSGPYVQGKAVRCVAHGDGHFEVGVELIPEGSAELI